MRAIRSAQSNVSLINQTNPANANAGFKPHRTRSTKPSVASIHSGNQQLVKSHQSRKPCDEVARAFSC
jgi:hypothetical protein